MYIKNEKNGGGGGLCTEKRMLLKNRVIFLVFLQSLASGWIFKSRSGLESPRICCKSFPPCKKMSVS